MHWKQTLESVASGVGQSGAEPDVRVRIRAGIVAVQIEQTGVAAVVIGAPGVKGS